MKKITTFVMMIAVMLLLSCSENYSNGERIGFLVKFSEKGIWWKSWEGELNLTQTGMNTSSLFNFSLDNDRDNLSLQATLDSAARFNWKIKVTYHEVWGAKNCARNRGETDYFVTGVEVLDRHPMDIFGGNKTEIQSSTSSGKIIDTVYLIVVDPQKIKQYLK